jgi:hypothetical protein
MMVAAKSGPSEQEHQTHQNHKEGILGKGEYFLLSDFVQNSWGSFAVLGTGE